ncbi:MAG TPA: hypothetical protein VGI36_15610, partial [Candidatus Binataceae bacterium]
VSNLARAVFVAKPGFAQRHHAPASLTALRVPSGLLSAAARHCALIGARLSGSGSRCVPCCDVVCIAGR